MQLSNQGKLKLFPRNVFPRVSRSASVTFIDNYMPNAGTCGKKIAKPCLRLESCFLYRALAGYIPFRLRMKHFPTPRGGGSHLPCEA